MFPIRLFVRERLLQGCGGDGGFGEALLRLVADAVEGGNPFRVDELDVADEMELGVEGGEDGWG